MLKNLLTFSLFAACMASQVGFAQGGGYVSERFSVVGIISENRGEKRNDSIAMVFDKQSKKNIVLRVGDKLPGDSAYKVENIDAKQVQLSDHYGNKVALVRDAFAGPSEQVAAAQPPLSRASRFQDDDFEDEEEEEYLPPPPPPVGNSRALNAIRRSDGSEYKSDIEMNNGVQIQRKRDPHTYTQFGNKFSNSGSGGDGRMIPPPARGDDYRRGSGGGNDSEAFIEFED